MVNKKFGLNQNQLKFIAAISMALDHIGFMLFPNIALFRMLGRLSFPLFAYFIYQGSKYTHSKAKYLCRLLSLGLIYILGYYIYSGEIYVNVFITFSLSLVNLYSVQFLKAKVKEKNKLGLAVGIILTLAAVAAAYLICMVCNVDYGFYGIMLPVLTEIFDLKPDKCIMIKNICLKFSFIGFSLGLVLVSYKSGGIQYLSLLTLILLLLYNGYRGKNKYKSFFYWFYPIHLLMIGIMAAIV